MISGIIPSLYWVKVFQTSFLQIAKTRQLPIQIFIYHLIYWGTRNVFHRTMKHMFLKEVSIFNTCLINNISCFISNLFNLKLNILNLDWSQESYSLYFENILLWPGYNNYHKIAIHDYICVPKFCHTWCMSANTKKNISGIIPFT